MKTVIVGYDGSEASDRALARAADVASAFSARLIVVSVSNWADVTVPAPALEPVGPVMMQPGGPVAVPVPGYRPEDLGGQQPDPEQLSRRCLEQARAALAQKDVRAEYVAEVGDPADRLLALAEQRAADLIVVGSREHGFLERLLGRGVEATVARRADGDVLLVH